MISSSKELLLILFFFIIPVCCPSFAIAGDITIIGKGLYQLVPVEKDESPSSNVLHLKEYALIEETTEIEAVKGTAFGFELMLSADAPLSSVLKITHPQIKDPVGMGYTSINTFPVLIQPGKKYFIGWNFSENYELQSGEWIFELENPDSPECIFTVKNVEELVYDGKQLESKAEKPQPIPVTPKDSLSQELPYGGILTRYLVRGGIFPDLKAAEANAEKVRQRGVEPFIFIRKKDGGYWYYLFLRMFDTENEAEEFATKYRQEFRHKAVPQKVQLELAPMD